MTRRSIRKYTGEHISDEDLHTILTAGMAAPSCVNARDWSFFVTRDRDLLLKMAEANGRPAEPLKTCDVGILVAGDLERAFARAKDYWIIDCAIAAENMVLAAHSLGIGSVWLGTYPQMERVENQKKLLGLPDHIIPHSVIAFGYPAETREEKPFVYEENRVHFEKW